MYIVWSYSIYLVISLVVTVWVAKTLHRNGRVFLIEAFGGNADLADSVNHLLVVGFYLINVGFVALALKSNQHPINTQQSIELLSEKLGWVLLILGGMHFFNLYVFSRIRKRGGSRLHPPLPPDGTVPVPVRG